MALSRRWSHWNKHVLRKWKANKHTHLSASLGPIFDQLTAIGFSFSMHAASTRACPTRFARIRSLGLVLSSPDRLMLMSALESRFTHSMRFLALVEHSNGRIHRTRTPCANTLSSSPRRANTFTHLASRFLVCFVTCSSSLDRWWENYSSFFPAAGDSGPTGSSASMCIHFLGISISSNECSSLCP